MSGAGKRRRRSFPAPSAAGAFGHGDLPTSLLLIFPLFLAYQIGVMFSDVENGVDFLTRWVFVAVGRDRENYLLVHLGLAVLFLGLLFYLRSKRSFRLRMWPPVVLEGAIYAVSLGSVIVLVMENLLGFELSIGGAMLELGKSGQAMVMSLGAGVYEELVFRLGMMGGGAAALMWAGVRRGWAVFWSLAISAVIFSAAHHVGALGDPWKLDVFTYRTLAGVVFGVIFYFRSLAHAVYAHFLYDVYVMLLR